MPDCVSYQASAEPSASLVLLSSNVLLGQLLRHYIEQRQWELRPADGVGLDSGALWLIDAHSYNDTVLSQLFDELYGRGPVALVNIDSSQAERLVDRYPWINGVFLSSCSREQFLLGIDVLLGGGDWLPRGLMEGLLRQLRRLRQPAEVKARLTEREREILELIRKGLPNAEIAEHLCLSPHTIKSHVHNLLRKIGATNRAEAAFLVLGGASE